MQIISRRGFIASCSAFLLSASQFLRQSLHSWCNFCLLYSPKSPELSQGALDLHAVFRDEIGTNFKDNVYASLGNKLQLDGRAYVCVSEALSAVEFIGIIRSSSISDSARENLLTDQIAKTEAAFLEAVTSLDWPKYFVSLEKQQINVTGPSHLDLYARQSQFVMFVFTSNTSSDQNIRMECDEISLPVARLQVKPHSSRYVLASVNRQSKGKCVIKITFTTERVSRDFTIAADVAETAILRGVLVADEQDVESPMARIRVTDLGGRYFPPEVQPSGIVRMLTDDHITRAERWVYADREFHVRVPVGKIRVSIRRGLEYRSLDEEIEIKDETTLEKRFVLSRWAHMEKEGWYPGDVHLHDLDPETALYESRAECLSFVNVMVYKHLKYVSAREHFSGGLDPISDGRHFIYYNEEFRNEPMGHIQLINIKRLVEPISTGRLGLNWPSTETYDDISMPLPSHGDEDSPDFPLLLNAMRETHDQGGLVGWAHLRSSQWEFPLDAAEGQIDFADIMTHTEIPKDLQLWYALLNCDFNIPASAGTDREAPVGPIGHQRVYARLDAPLSYASWIKALKGGASFVTNGPMLHLHVNALAPGDALHLSEPTDISISASAFSQIPFEKLEIIMNGEIVHSGEATGKRLSARTSLTHQVKESVWIAARCIGPWDKELFYSNPVFAHTNPVYVHYRKERIAKAESAEFLLSFLRKLESWVEHEAYFRNSQQKIEVVGTIRAGMRYYEKISATS